MMTMFLFLDHVANFYEFIFPSLDFMTVELERMVDQQIMTSSHRGHMSTINGFISPSLTPITSKFCRMVDSFALVLASTWK